MINKSVFSILFFAFIQVNTFAQQKPDFVVYFTKGKVWQINAPKSRALKIGDKLYASNWVSISPKGQLILICENHNSIKIDKPDTIKLITVLGKCNQNNSFTTAYFSFVWDELNEKQPDVRNYMHNVGAVTRGGPSPKFNVSPDGINYSKGPITIKWADDMSEVNVTIYTNPNDSHPIKSYPGIHNYVKLDSLISSLTPGDYYWSINDLEPKNASRHHIHIWQSIGYKHAVDSVLKETLISSPAETAYMSGFQLEKAGFLVEAAKCYRKASFLDPKNQTYQTAKLRFYEK